MAYFPMFIQLEKERCLVVGGGKVALRKVQVLQDFGAKVEVVAETVCAEIKELSEVNAEVVYTEKAFEEEDLKDVFLVVTATDEKEKNHKIARLCKEKKIYINAVDQIEDCGFIFPSYIKEGPVVGAFSSGGNSPVVTQYLKNCMRGELTPFIGEIADFLGGIRDEVKKNTGTEAERKKIYGTLLELVLDTGKIPDKKNITGIIQMCKNGD